MRGVRRNGRVRHAQRKRRLSEPPPRRRQVEDLAGFDAVVEAGALGEAVVQGVDLSERSEELLSAECAGAVFLGCRMHEGVVLHLTARGAVLFPDLSVDRPYHPTRGRLYSYDELMEGFDRKRPGSGRDTVDAQIYAAHRDQQVRHRTLDALAERLHDHAVDDALRGLLARHPTGRVVGVMGGHALRRGEDLYADIARIGHRLTTAGRLVATGGGPGAMEAANLGAWMSAYPAGDLDRALALLAPAPRYDTHAYLVAADDVRRRWPDGADSLAIPTWFYGHEPTNAFAPHIAKYFSNSLREDGLLGIATGGVIYAPGSAGTVQEIFMDAAQNHYATFGAISPMVLFGERHWIEELPVADLLARLGRDHPWRELVAVHDDVAGAVDYLLAHPPRAPDGSRLGA